MDVALGCTILSFWRSRLGSFVEARLFISRRIGNEKLTYFGWTKVGRWRPVAVGEETEA